MPKASSPVDQDLGYVGVIDVGSEWVPVATTEEAFGELTDLAIAKDRDGILKMGEAGTAFLVENGTKAKIIGRNWTGGVRIRVLSGNWKGNDGWIPAEFLK